ncbi:MAG: hypothetical protein V1936_03470 [Patescibacteria group bacterium]
MQRTIGVPDDQIKIPLAKIFELDANGQRSVGIFQVLNKALEEINDEKEPSLSFWRQLIELMAHTYRNQIGFVLRQNDKAGRKEICPELTKFQKCFDEVLAQLMRITPREEEQSCTILIPFSVLSDLCDAAVKKLIAVRVAEKKEGQNLTAEEIQKIIGEIKLSQQQILLLQRALFFIAERNRSIRKGAGELAVDDISSVASQDIQSDIDAAARLLALNIVQHLKIAGDNGHCAFVFRSVGDLKIIAEDAKTEINPHARPHPQTPIHVLRECGFGQ